MKSKKAFEIKRIMSILTLAMVTVFGLNSQAWFQGTQTPNFEVKKVYFHYSSDTFMAAQNVGLVVVEQAYTAGISLAVTEFNFAKTTAEISQIQSANFVQLVPNNFSPIIAQTMDNKVGETGELVVIQSNDYRQIVFTNNSSKISAYLFVPNQNQSSQEFIISNGVYKELLLSSSATVSALIAIQSSNVSGDFLKSQISSNYYQVLLC